MRGAKTRRAARATPARRDEWARADAERARAREVIGARSPARGEGRGRPGRGGGGAGGAAGGGGVGGAGGGLCLLAAVGECGYRKIRG